jgi:predicted DNA binding CopG/RHH family protein
MCIYKLGRRKHFVNTKGNKKVKKDKILHMRLSEKEKLDLQKKADAVGMTVSEYVRATLIKTESRPAQSVCE